MKKRIFKTLGIVLAIVFGLFGIIVGVMAITGKFRADPIYPSRLSFVVDNPSDNSITRTYDPDKPDELYSFILNADSNKSKPVNQTTVYVALSGKNMVSGKNLIILTDANKNPLQIDSEGYYKTNCNRETYFMVNREAVEATYTSASYGFVEVSGLAKGEGEIPVSAKEKLKINIDIKAKDINICNNGYSSAPAINGGTTVFVKSGVAFDLEFEIGPNNALSSVTNSIKKIELYNDNLDGTYNLITPDNCSNYNLTWVGGAAVKGSSVTERNIFKTGYQFESDKDAFSKSFVAAIYPTFDYKLDDESIINNPNLVYNEHISQIPFCKFTLEVQANDVNDVMFQGTSRTLSLNLDNNIEIDKLVSLGGTQVTPRLKEIDFGIADENNAFYSPDIEFVYNENQSILIKQNPSNYQIVNRTGDNYSINVNDITYAINIDSRLTLRSSDGQIEYRPVTSIQSTTSNENYFANVAVFVRKFAGQFSLVCLPTGSYMDFYISSTNLSGISYKTALKSEFNYSVTKQSDGLTFVIRPLSEIGNTDVVLNMFVINSNGKLVLSRNTCQISTRVEVGTPTRIVQDLSLNVSYNSTERLFSTTQISDLYNLTNAAKEDYSYTTYALATLNTSSGLDVLDKSFDFNGNTYSLLGYQQGDEYVNAVRANKDIIEANSHMPEVFLVLLKTNEDFSSYLKNTTGQIAVHNVFANANLEVSTNLKLNITTEDLQFSFSTTESDYLQQESGQAKFVYHVYEQGTKNNKLTISSNNKLILQDMHSVYGETNLVSLLNDEGRLSATSEQFTINYTNDAYEIAFSDVIVAPSDYDYYRFALNIGSQVIDNTRVYFVPNTPENVQLKMENVNDNNPINLARSVGDVDSYASIKIELNWDESQSDYTYKYFLIENGNEHSISNINQLFNNKAVGENEFGFYATPYPKLSRKLSYNVSAASDSLSISTGQEYGLLQVDGITGDGYAVIEITCGNENSNNYDNKTIKAYLKVEIKLEEGATFNSSVESEAPIKKSELSLIKDNYFSYTYNDTPISIDGAVFSNLKITYNNGEHYNVNCEKVVLGKPATISMMRLANNQTVASITDDNDNIILNIEYKDVDNGNYDLVFTRVYDINTRLDITFNLKLKTIEQPVEISLKFSPPLQLERNVNKWNLGYYQGTKVLLYEVYKTDNEMSETKNEPVFKILNEDSETSKIVVEYVLPNQSETNTVDENGEFTFDKTGEYKFHFYTQKDGVKTEITQQDYVISVRENCVVVLKDTIKNNTLNLQTDNNYQLSDYVSLKSYSTQDIVYGKENNGTTKLYSDSTLLQDAASEQLTNIGFTSDAIKIENGQIVVAWQNQLEYNENFDITLNLSGTPIQIWGYNEVNKLVNLASITISVTNKYSITEKLNTLNTYTDYNFSTLFNLDGGTLNLNISNVEVLPANSDFNFNVQDGKLNVSILNADNEYTLTLLFTFDDGGKTLIGEYTFTIVPSKPTEVENDLEFAKDESADIINKAYNIAKNESVGELTYISKILVQQILINGQINNIDGEIGYINANSVWAAAANGNEIDLSRFANNINTDKVDATIKILIVYSDEKTYTYNLQITINNNLQIIVNYPIDVSKILQPETLNHITYMDGQTENNFRFDSYEIVILQQNTNGTTIDLGLDKVTNFARVGLMKAENGVISTTPLKADENLKIALYAFDVLSDSRYITEGIKINGTKISFALPFKKDVDHMYFIFRIEYKDAQVKYYYVRTQYISENSTLAGTDYNNTKNVYVNSDGGKILSVDEEIKIFDTSIKNSLDELFITQSNYSAENIKLFYLNAESLAEIDLNKLISTNRGELLDDAVLSNLSTHLLIRMAVYYYNENEIFAPIGVLNVYVTPNQSEMGHLNEQVENADENGTTGEYNVKLKQIGTFNLFKDDSFRNVTFKIEAINSAFTTELVDGGTEIKYNDSTILTIKNSSVEVVNFVDTTLEFTVIYTLNDNGLTIKVNFNFGGIQPKDSSTEILGNAFDGSTFNNFLKISKYVPEIYNGKIKFALGNQLSQLIDFKNNDSTGVLDNIKIDGKNISYGYIDGTLALYFEQDNNEHTLEHLIIYMENLITNNNSVEIVKLTVKSKLNITFNKGETENNAYELKNINRNEDGSVNYNDSEGKGSSIYVEKTIISNLAQYKIYDSSNKGEVLLTLVTSEDATFTIYFRDASNRTVSSEFVKKMVLNAEDGKLEISENIEIKFAHLAQAKTIVLELQVEGYTTGNNYYYLTLPQTYIGLRAVYEIENTEYEIVKPSDEYSFEKLFNSVQAVNDILTSKQITNSRKLKLIDLEGKETDNYLPDAVGFTNKDSINYLTIRTNYSDLINIDNNSNSITFNMVETSSTATINLINNYLGLNCSYTFSIMRNGNGLDTTEYGNKIFEDNIRYTTHFINDVSTSFEDNLTLGQIRDANSQMFISNISITEGKSSTQTLPGNSSISVLEGAIKTTNFTYKFELDRNVLKLNLSRSGGEAVGCIVVQFTLYGNSKVEENFTLYIYNVKETENITSTFYGASTNTINLSQIYKYEYNSADFGDLNLKYEIVKDLSHAELVSTKKNVDINEHLFSQNNSILTLTNQVQDIDVTLTIQIKNSISTQEENYKIIAEKEFSFTIKQGINLFVNKDGTYTNFNDFHETIECRFTNDFALPYVWNLSSSMTIGDKYSYNIVAKQLDSDKTLSLTTVLANVSCDELDIRYENGMIYFNEDINNPTKVYTLVFKIIGENEITTYEQQLNVTFTGFVQISYLKGNSLIENDTDQNGGFNSGYNIKPITNQQVTYDNTTAINVSTALTDYKIYYRYIIVDHLEWLNHQADSYWANEFEPLKFVEIKLNDSLQLPTSNFKNSVVIYQFKLEYIKISDNEYFTTGYYYAKYKLNATNYIDKLADGKQQIDVGNSTNILTEQNQAFLPLMYFEQTFTVTDELSSLGEITFKLKEKSGDIVCVLIANNKEFAYTYNEDQHQWCFANENETYYVDFARNSITLEGGQSGQLQVKETKFSSDSFSTLFTLKENINILDYFAFAKDLLKNGRVKFAAQTLPENFPESFVIEYKNVEDNIVLGCDLIKDIKENEHLFNNSLTATIQLFLNNQNILESIQPTITLVTKNGITLLQDATPYTLQQILGNYDDYDSLQILGICRTSEIQTNAINWVKNATEIEFDGNVYYSRQVYSKTFNVYKITLKSSMGQASKLYSTDMIAYVIGLDSENDLVYTNSTHDSRTFTGNNPDDESYIEILNCSDIFSVWGMQNNILTKKSNSNLTYSITYSSKNDNNGISSSNFNGLGSESSGVISVKASALYNWFNTNSESKSVILYFNINYEEISVTITKANN